jgi:hypothetical protein
MSIEMSVKKVGLPINKPWRHSVRAHPTSRRPDAKAAADAAIPCAAVSLTFAPPQPSPLLPASSVCALAPGPYVVTARLVDGTGVVTTTNRTITVDLSKTEPSSHGV